MRSGARLRLWGERAFAAASELNVADVERLLASVPPHGRLLDLGCDDGTRTVRFAAAAHAEEVHGVEVVAERADSARRRGIDAVVADLESPLPLDERSFDAIVANRVIEHLADTDTFVREAFRVLRPGGAFVVSTDNLASWHNVGALFAGWQPFSLTNVSDRALGIGNPLALHRGEPSDHRSWQHVRVFSHRALRELLVAHGFVVERVVGAGYYPLPARVGRLDPRHAVYLAVKAIRPHDA